MGVDEHPEHEHEHHPEGGGGADLGHVHDAIVEEEGPGWAGTAGSRRPPGGRGQHGHDGFRSRSAATTATW